MKFLVCWSLPLIAWSRTFKVPLSIQQASLRTKIKDIQPHNYTENILQYMPESRLSCTQAVNDFICRSTFGPKYKASTNTIKTVTADACQELWCEDTTNSQYLPMVTWLKEGELCKLDSYCVAEKCRHKIQFSYYEN